MHDLATLDDHDPVADPLHLLEVVGRDDDVHAELGADAADEIEHLRPLHRVEPVGRLVEEDDLGVVGDRGGELHALPLPRGHRPDGAEALLAEADQPERVVGALHGRAARQQVHLGEVTDEIGRGQLRRQIVVLGRVADARSQLEPGRRRILAEHGQLAGVPGAEPEEDGDERRLAGAVRAEQAGDPGADLGVEARERDRLAVALHDPARRDDSVRLGLRQIAHAPNATCHSHPLPWRGAAALAQRVRLSTEHEAEVELPPTAELVLGENSLAPLGVAIVRGRVTRVTVSGTCQTRVTRLPLSGTCQYPRNPRHRSPSRRFRGTPRP